MEIRINQNTLLFSVTNLSSFRKLMQQAAEEAKQLERTMRELANFELAIELIQRPEPYAGDMDAASSVISTMPMK